MAYNYAELPLTDVLPVTIDLYFCLFVCLFVVVVVVGGGGGGDGVFPSC